MPDDKALPDGDKALLDDRILYDNVKKLSGDDRISRYNVKTSSGNVKTLPDNAKPLPHNDKIALNKDINKSFLIEFH